MAIGKYHVQATIACQYALHLKEGEGRMKVGETHLDLAASADNPKGQVLSLCETVNYRRQDNTSQGLLVRRAVGEDNGVKDIVDHVKPIANNAAVVIKPVCGEWWSAVGVEQRRDRKRKIIRDRDKRDRGRALGERRKERDRERRERRETQGYIYI